VVKVLKATTVNNLAHDDLVFDAAQQRQLRHSQTAAPN